MSKYYEICPRCKGEKYLYSGEWNEYTPQLSELAEDQGISLGEAMRQLAKNNIKPPSGPEVYFCSECHGRGVIATPEGLDILDFLDKIRG